MAIATSAMVGVVPSAALAHGDSGGMQLPPDAPAVTKDGEAAKAIVAELETDASAKEIAKDAIARSKRAISRAHGAKAAGDDIGADLLSKLALELANDAKAVVRAAAAEKKQDDALILEKGRRDELERTKALLIEIEGHREQVKVELERARAAAKERMDAAQAKEDVRVSRGARKKPKDAASPLMVGGPGALPSRATAPSQKTAPPATPTTPSNKDGKKP